MDQHSEYYFAVSQTREAAFYERYPPEEARHLAERVEFIYTPVHGSWLNPVESNSV